jgi:hypothetical protein
MNENGPRGGYTGRGWSATVEPGMPQFAHIERRIDCLCSHASSHRVDAWVLAEMGDVLAVGYVSALQADAHCRGLAERINRLLEDLDHPRAVDEVRRLAKERRAVDDATHRLRARLDVVRTSFARAGARADSA